MVLFALFIVTPLLGGPRDKPIIWRLGANYHSIMEEAYWGSVYKGMGHTFQYKPSTGVYGHIDFVSARFQAEEKYRYATTTHRHLEFARKAHKFMSPKALYFGYILEYYILEGEGGLGKLTTRITTPGGIGVGVLCGILPVYPYLFLSVGASFVSESWEFEGIEGDTLMGGPSKGTAESTGFWGNVKVGILYQLRGYFALDLSGNFNYLTLRHNKEAKIPRPKEEVEVIQDTKIGIGLIFAMPWKVEKTIR